MKLIILLIIYFIAIIIGINIAVNYVANDLLKNKQINSLKADYIKSCEYIKKIIKNIMFLK
jgi:hypothetical protein